MSAEVNYAKLLLWWAEPTAQAKLLELFAAFFEGMVNYETNAVAAWKAPAPVDAKTSGTPSESQQVALSALFDRVAAVSQFNLATGKWEKTTGRASNAPSLEMEPMDLPLYMSYSRVLTFLYYAMMSNRPISELLMASLATSDQTVADALQGTAEGKHNTANLRQNYNTALVEAKGIDTSKLRKPNVPLQLLTNVIWSATNPASTAMLVVRKAELVDAELYLDDLLWWEPMQVETHVSRSENLSNMVLTVAPNTPNGITLRHFLTELYTFYTTPLEGKDLKIIQEGKNDVFDYVKDAQKAITAGKPVTWSDLIGEAKYFGCLTVTPLTSTAYLDYGT